MADCFVRYVKAYTLMLKMCWTPKLLCCNVCWSRR